MSDNDDIYRRLGKLEDSNENLTRGLSDLVANTRVMNETLTMLSTIEPRLRAVENKTLSNEIVLSGIRWIGAIVVGTGVTVTVAAILSTVITGG